MSQHSCGVGLAQRPVGNRYGLLSPQIANGDCGNLQRSLRNASDAENAASWRLFGKIRSEGVVQFRVMTCVLKIDLNVNDVVHSESGSFDQALDVVEALAHLLGKLGGGRSVCTVRSLGGDVQVVSGIDAGRARHGGGRRDGLRGGNTRLEERESREEQRRGAKQTYHAGFPCRAALRMVRKRRPTIISSPG